jgi:hypothetical protein
LHTLGGIRLTKKRRNGTGGERATTAIARYRLLASDRRGVESSQTRAYRHQLSESSAIRKLSERFRQKLNRVIIWIRSCEDPPKSWIFSPSSAFLGDAPSVDEVKSLSPHHRFVIALHSPGGVDETRLPQCPSEKKPRELVREIQRDIFSGPV